MSIAANKIPGVRAALCHESYSARMARAHNDANVLCIGGRVVEQVERQHVEVAPAAEQEGPGLCLLHLAGLVEGVEELLDDPSPVVGVDPLDCMGRGLLPAAADGEQPFGQSDLPGRGVECQQQGPIGKGEELLPCPTTR